MGQKQLVRQGKDGEKVVVIHFTPNIGQMILLQERQQLTLLCRGCCVVWTESVPRRSREVFGLGSSTQFRELLEG
jgi:hypothetical protein